MIRPVALLLALTLPVALAGDMPERGRELMRLVPELDPQVAGHLVRDTEDEFRRYCREIGPIRTFDAMAWIQKNLRPDTPETYRRSMMALNPYLSRAADVMSYEFDRPEFARIYQFRMSLAETSWTHAWNYRQLVLALDSLQWDGTLSLADKLKRYRTLAGFAAYPDERELINIDAALAREAGIPLALRVPLMRRALAGLQRRSEHLMVCQLLGDLSHAHEEMGQLDSALACIREGITVADKYFILDQATRLRIFEANHYFESGRLVLGAKLLEEALAVNRRYGGNPLDIRPLITATERYARLECWDMVEHNTQRFPALIRELRRSRHFYEAGQYTLTARRLGALCLAHKGRAPEAADSLARLFEDARLTAKPEALSEILRQRAEVLLRAGRAREARLSAGTGIGHAKDHELNAERRALGLTFARAALQESRPDLAELGLAHATRDLGSGAPAPMPPAYILDAIRSRVALERSDPVTAHRLIRQGLQELRDQMRTLDRGPQTDLTILAAEDVWLAGHALLDGVPSDDLAFERHWRSLVSGGGAVTDPGPRIPDVAVPPRTMHLLYAMMPEGIVRWTALPTGIRRERLALDPGECRQLVERVFEQASTDPEAVYALIPTELRSLARELGRALLPPEVQDGGFDQVAISAEGPLGRLPFELLDASAGSDYLPLLLRSDVRYLRHVMPRATRASDGRSVILADSTGTKAAGGGRRALARLNAVEVEVARANAILPGSRIIRGSETSKHALLREWSRASIVYVAAHLVRDDAAPLLNYFPIAFGGTSRSREDDYIDIRDVRDTDLSRCRLVVLSSCASGEPYVAGTRSGPSMADAFLDAGARAAIHTRWRVRDEVAAETAPELTAAWFGKAGGWHDARRARIRGPNGIRHPFEWAAWSVTTAQPVPEWKGLPISVAKRSPAPAPPAGREASSARVE